MRSTRIPIRRLLAFPTALLYLAPVYVAAQTTPADPPPATAVEPEGGPQAEGPRRPRGEIEEIVVTARKREENLQEVPVAITAVPASELQSGFNRDLEDFEGITPNLIIDPVKAGPQGAAISIRGISFQDIEKSFDPAIGILVDEVYIGTNTTALQNNFDLESIEILRGPQGTLFGKNTTGGAIRLNRTRPTGEWGLRGQVTTGRFSRHDWRLVANAPLLEDKLALKTWFFSQNDDGTSWNPIKGRRVGKQDYISVGAALRMNPIDDLELLLTYEHIRDRTSAGPYVNLSQRPGSQDVPTGDVLCAHPLFGQCAITTTERTDFQNFSDHAELDLDAVTLRADYDVDFGTFTSITAWRGNDELVNLDFDASPIDFFTTVRDQEYTQVSEEFRYTGSFEGLFGTDTLQLDVVAGVYLWYANYELDMDTLFLLPNLVTAGVVPPGTFPPGLTQLLSNPDTFTVQGTEHDTYSVAPFFQLDLHVTDWLRVTGGLRYTYERKKIETATSTVIPTPGLLLTNPVLSDSEAWDEVTPRIGFDIQPMDNVLTYFSWSRGFKSGGYNGRAISATSIGPFDPEIVDSLELGLKSDWWDRRLRFNLTLFWNFYKDKQEEIVQIAPPPFFQETVVINASEAETRGIEIELTAIPFEGFTLRSSFGYLHAEFTDGTENIVGLPVEAGGVLEDFEDFALRRAPRFQYAFYGEYARDIGPGTAILNLNWRWVDNYETTTQNFRFGRVNDVGLLDAGLTYEYEDSHARVWRFSAFGRNLTNQRYVASAIHVAGLFSFGGINNPRTWNLEFGMKF